MDVYVRFAPQPAQVLLGAIVVLPSANQFLNRGIEGLDADLELQAPGRKPRDEFAQRVWQSIRDHLEVNEQGRLHPLQKELQNRTAGLNVQIERPVDEFELSYAPLEQGFHRLEERIQRRLANRHFQRRQTELAGEWTSPGRFDVDHSISDIAFAVEIVREPQIAEERRVRMNDFVERPLPRQESPAQHGEFEVRFPGDREIREPNDLLRIEFVA